MTDTVLAQLSDHLTFEGQKQKVHSLVDKVTLSH